MLIVLQKKQTTEFDLSLYSVITYTSINKMDNQGFFQFNYLIYRYLQAFALSDDDLSAIRLAVVYPEIRFLYPHYMTILGYECFI